jgi:hypothetical protein
MLAEDTKRFTSFLLLNERSLTVMHANKSAINLNINLASCWVTDASDPEAVMGYGEDFVRALYDKYKLEIKEPVHYVAWCGREEFLSYQDLILAFKAPGGTKIRGEYRSRLSERSSEAIVGMDK